MDKLEDIKEDILDRVIQYSNLKYKNQEIRPGIDYIPPSGKVIGSTEINNMVEASLDGWLTSGRFNAKFEKKLAEFLNVNYALTVNSGSSANLIAFSTLTSPELGQKAIKKGDEVITVAAGFPTTVNPIIQFGAIPVFVDINIKTHNINEDLIENAINEKTKAIVLAHTLGIPFNLKRVKELCNKYNLWLIEDTCDALGATFEGKLVGTFGDISTLSFYPAHHITMGEGGAVYTNSRKLKKIAESFRDWGRDCFCPPGKNNTCGCRFEQAHGSLPFGYDHKYVYSNLGYNLKITDMQAACGLAQLEKLEYFISKRRSNYNYLHNRLKELNNYIELSEPHKDSNPSWFGFPITIKGNSNYNRLALINFLESNKIGTRLVFAGNLTRQPYMSNCVYKVSGELKDTDKSMNNTFWVGIYPELNELHLDYIFDKLKDFFVAS